MKRMAASVLLLVFTATQLFASDLTGQRIVSDTARNHLAENARQNLQLLFGNDDLAAISTWADEVRVKTFTIADHYPSCHRQASQVTLNVAVLPSGPNTSSSTAPSYLLSIGTIPDQARDGSKKLMVLLAVTNRSDHQINFDRNLERNDIEVRDEKGNPPPLTEMGWKLRNEFEKVPANPLPLAVKPRETTSGGGFYLDEVYDLKRPGQYTIQVGGFDDETNIYIRSNTVRIIFQ